MIPYDRHAEVVLGAFLQNFRFEGMNGKAGGRKGSKVEVDDALHGGRDRYARLWSPAAAVLGGSPPLGYTHPRGRLVRRPVRPRIVHTEEPP